MQATVHYCKLPIEDLQNIYDWLRRDRGRCSNWILSNFTISWKASFSLGAEVLPEMVEKFGTDGTCTFDPVSPDATQEERVCDDIYALLNGRFGDIAKDIGPCPEGRASFILIDGDIIVIENSGRSSYFILFRVWRRLLEG